MWNRRKLASDFHFQRESLHNPTKNHSRREDFAENDVLQKILQKSKSHRNSIVTIFPRCFDVRRFKISIDRALIFHWPNRTARILFIRVKTTFIVRKVANKCTLSCGVSCFRFLFRLLLVSGVLITIGFFTSWEVESTWIASFCELSDSEVSTLYIQWFQSVVKFCLIYIYVKL